MLNQIVARAIVPMAFPAFFYFYCFEYMDWNIGGWFVLLFVMFMSFVHTPVGGHLYRPSCLYVVALFMEETTVFASIFAASWGVYEFCYLLLADETLAGSIAFFFAMHFAAEYLNDTDFTSGSREEMKRFVVISILPFFVAAGVYGAMNHYGWHRFFVGVATAMSYRLVFVALRRTTEWQG